MSQRKRRHQTAAAVDDEEEETVDDLAVAASFAMAGLAGMAGDNHQQEEDTSSDDDDEESSDDDDDEEEESSEDEKAEGKDAADTYANDEEKTTEESPAKDSSVNNGSGNDHVKEESDSDDESDVDLSEALARMVGESGDEAGASDDDEGANGGGGRRRGARGSGRRGKPKAEVSSTAPLRTENEIDPYACEVSVLEEKLAIDLRVNTTAGQANGVKADTGATNKAVGISNDVQLCPAGRVKNHLVKERTIVVESGLGMVTFASGPLDEGSLLVVRAGTSTTTGSSSGAKAPEAGSSTAIIPLGRVFEVFGPVKQPLYTIRLLSPKDLVRKAPPKPKPQSAETVVGSTSAEADDNIKEGDAADDNAIDLDEDGEDEQGEEKVAKGDEANGDEAKGADTTAVPQEETKKDEDKDEEEKEEADPWAEDGQHTKLLRDQPNIEVYFVRDEAKLIDTNNVIKLSGKGCDASNLYDEELNANEIDFSDDEEERMAKRKAKDRKNAKRNDGQQRGGPGGRVGRGTGGRGGRGRNNGGGRGGWGGHSNFHHHQYQQPPLMAMAPPQPQMMGAPPIPYGNQYPQYGTQQPPMPMHPQGFQQMPYPQYQQNLPTMPPPPPPHQPYAGAGGYVVQAPQQYGTGTPGGVPPPPPPPQGAYQVQPPNYPGYPSQQLQMQGQQQQMPPYPVPHGQGQVAQVQQQQQQQQQGSDTVYYDYGN